MDDAAFALACAILLNPEIAQQAQESRPLQMPVVVQKDDWLLQTPAGIDRKGNAYDAGQKASAQYKWLGPGIMNLSERAGKPELAHEMTHHLQHMARVDPGAEHTSEQRRQIEAQAYRTEHLAPHECLTFWGNWDTDKLGPLARKLTKGAQ